MGSERASSFRASRRMRGSDADQAIRADRRKIVPARGLASAESLVAVPHWLRLIEDAYYRGPSSHV
jgi:hypothetical protein